MSPQRDKALRRLVAELSTARPKDIQAVLGDLSHEQREAIEGLLAAYAAPAAGVGERSVQKGVSNLSGLSPWLNSRLALSAGDNHQTKRSIWPEFLKPARSSEMPQVIRMTAAALNALQNSAQRHLHQAGMIPLASAQEDSGQRLERPFDYETAR